MKPTMIAHVDIGGKAFQIKTDQFANEDQMAKFFAANMYQHLMTITDENGNVL